MITILQLLFEEIFFAKCRLRYSDSTSVSAGIANHSCLTTYYIFPSSCLFTILYVHSEPYQKKEWRQAYHKINFASELIAQQSNTEKFSGHYTSSSAVFRLLHSNSIEEQYKCHYEKYVQ